MTIPPPPDIPRSAPHTSSTKGKSQILTVALLVAIVMIPVSILLTSYYYQLQLQMMASRLDIEPVSRSTTIANGTTYLVGTGDVEYIQFTSPSNVDSARLDVEFRSSERNDNAIEVKLSLLNRTQYETFRNCNCVWYGNDSQISRTWSSPWSTFYTALVTVPYPGTWYLAFQMPPSTGNERYVTHTIVLITTE